MLYFNLVANKYLVSVMDGRKDKAAESYVCRMDFHTLADAETMAARANELDDGHRYLAVDRGGAYHPRFDVVRMWKVGDKVSVVIDSNYYPEGEIVSVGSGAKMIITTSKGSKFYRLRNTGTWIRMGGVGGLVAGWHTERNRDA